MVSDMSNNNSQNPRKVILSYIEKLGEIDTKEDELVELKKEATELKAEIDKYREEKRNGRSKNVGSND
jgi:cell division protein FtsB